MGLGSRIKGALFEEGPPKPGSRPASTVGVSQPSPSIPVATVVTTGAPDDKVLGTLTAAIDRASGPAWQQFQGLRASLGSIIKDEATLYQAALKAGEGQGLTYASLEAAAAQRLELLKQEQKNFERQLSARSENDVPGKEAQLRQIEQQLATLQAQMGQLQHQRDTLVSDMEQARSRLESVRQKFNTAQAALQVILEQELARIRNHLQKA